MAFGTEIKRLREVHNVSAQVFADAVGIDAERLRAWEKKDLTPKADDTQAIEKYFGLSLDQLMKLKKLPKVPTKEEALNRKKMELAKKEIEVPVSDTVTGNAEPGDTEKVTMQSLAKAMELSEQTRLMEQENRKTELAIREKEIENMQRMISLLEMKFGSVDRPTFAKPGTHGTRTLASSEEKEVSQANLDS